MKRLQNTKNERFVGLLKEIKENKPNALNSFLREAQQTVLSFGMKVCGGNVEDAEDTMQETLIQFFRGAKKLEFKNSSALLVWLYKVAKNACLMSRRKGKYELEENEENIESLTLTDSSDDPENLVIKNENQHIIQEALLKIPINYRLVLILRDMEQLTTRDVAGVLDLTEQNVKVRLHRARLMMRKELLNRKNLIGEEIVIDEQN